MPDSSISPIDTADSPADEAARLALALGRGGRLPPGPSHLTREEVAESQRGRMADAIVRAVSEKGYAKTAVVDVITRAGVSRKAFYEHFDDKQDCFLYAYDATLEIVNGLMLEAIAQDGTPVERFFRAVRAYLEIVEHEPDFARAILVEVYAAGPEARARRVNSYDGFVAMLTTFLAEEAESAGVPPPPSWTAETIVASLSTMIFNRVVAGRHDEIVALYGPITEHCLMLMRSAGITSEPER